jgi:hypothetical protein
VATEKAGAGARWEARSEVADWVVVGRVEARVEARAAGVGTRAHAAACASKRTRTKLVSKAM